ncbi:MAG: hypothetical protein QG650_461 [Patescibacteria group bacterium]|nr:hypothetical protein [Patescibacteria group bacterium]
MAEFFPFVLTTGQTVYLNPDHIVSIRYNGGFYIVTTSELAASSSPVLKTQNLSNRTYEVKAIPFSLE